MVDALGTAWYARGVRCHTDRVPHGTNDRAGVAVARHEAARMAGGLDIYRRISNRGRRDSVQPPVVVDLTELVVTLPLTPETLAEIADDKCRGLRRVRKIEQEIARQGSNLLDRIMQVDRRRTARGVAGMVGHAQGQRNRRGSRRLRWRTPFDGGAGLGECAGVSSPLELQLFRRSVRVLDSGSDSDLLAGVGKVPRFVGTLAARND